MAWKDQKKMAGVLANVVERVELKIYYLEKLRTKQSGLFKDVRHKVLGRRIEGDGEAF
jgi:hypothetical protein